MVAIDKTVAATPARTRRTAERRIAAGLAVSLVLAIASGTVGVWRSVEARQRIGRIALAESQYFQYLSEIGRDVSRLRSAALEEVWEGTSPSGVIPPRQRVRALAGALDRRLAVLDPLLESRGHGQGEGLRGSLTAFRRALDRFDDAAARGDLEAREEALEEVLVLTSRVQSTLDAVLEESRAGTMRTLQNIDTELGRVASVEILISLLLVAGLAVVWMAVLRASRTSSRLIAEYVARTEQANRDLDAFAGRVAHDFRNVLAPLPLLSGRLRRGVEQEKAAEQLDRVARRGNALVSGLLAFSRMGAMPSEFGASVREAVVDVLDELNPLVVSSATRVELDLQDADVACAPALLHMVLANVMSNALKYMNGTPRRVIRVSSRAGAGGASIVIRDTGPGIPGEYLPHVFEPFFRVPGSRAEGTGLGLPTVKRIIEASGGYVSLKSEVGEGTTVTIWLPSVRSPIGRSSDPPAGRSADRPSELPPLIH